jgi:predicted Zn-dependent protease
MLAGALLGAGGGGELAQAVIMGSAAGGLTTLLAYSRENELEADQKGLEYIQEASFDPKGLLTGLNKIRTSDWLGVERIPNYLKTHPGTRDRIVSIDSWLEEHRDEGKQRYSPVSRYRFEMVKYRLAGLYGEEASTRRRIEGLLLKDPANPALYYGLALVLARQSRTVEAIETLRAGLARRTFDPYLLVEIGRLYTLSGEPEKALAILENLDLEGDLALTAAYWRGMSRLELGWFSRAESDLTLVVTKAPEAFPRVFHHLARLEAEQGNTGMSHFFLGKYYDGIDDVKSAKVHLQRSLKTLSDANRESEARELLKALDEKESDKDD